MKNLIGQKTVEGHTVVSIVVGWYFAATQGVTPKSERFSTYTEMYGEGWPDKVFVYLYLKEPQRPLSIEEFAKQSPSIKPEFLAEEYFRQVPEAKVIAMPLEQVELEESYLGEQ